MDHLHAYWRIDYIQRKETQNDAQRDNPFADLQTCENDREKLIIFRNVSSCILLNRYPYNAGHLLVVSYKTVPSLTDLTQPERADFLDSIIKGQKMLEKTMHPDGFNIGFNIGSAAGAGIAQHLHCHIVPRWNGDTNFMPVIGDTRVLPQALDHLWTLLSSITPTISTP